MIKHFLFLLLLPFSAKINGQNPEPWILRCDTSGEKCGYVDQNGAVKIPLGKYALCLTDTFVNRATVFKSGLGFCVIDKSEQLLFEIFNYDNGPDYTVEGLYRIVINQKMGFANDAGEIAVVPSFDFVKPFENGLAEFCFGCRRVKSGEHYTIEGGAWGLINKAGKIVVDPVFTRKNGGEGAWFLSGNGTAGMGKDLIVKKFYKKDK